MGMEPFTTAVDTDLDEATENRDAVAASCTDTESKGGNLRPRERLLLDADIIGRLEEMLLSVGHDPQAAAAGWRSADPVVTATLFAMFGYLVFPCDELKRPLTRRGFYNATCNLATISYWQRHKPARGWCIRTGRYGGTDGPAGMWIIDVDDAEGYAWLATLEARHGPLPPTWTNVSGREGGGEHRMFAPAAMGPDMKTVPRALIMGERGKIDQKGRGGYAVIAGSYHSTGKRYRWADGCAPDEVALAELPPAWVAAIDKADEAPPKAPASRPLKAAAARTKSVNHGDRSNLVLGDGPGGGGFHGPINGLAIRYFLKAGRDADGGALILLLQKLIEEAPKGLGRDVSRYLSAQYLSDAVEKARIFVRSISSDK